MGKGRPNMRVRHPQAGRATAMDKPPTGAEEEARRRTKCAPRQIVANGERARSSEGPQAARKEEEIRQGKGGTTGHAQRLAESEKYLAWVEQAGNEAMVAAATAYIEELRQERAQVQEGARDGLSSARLRKAETRLRKAEAQLKAAEDAVEKKAVELAEAESRREDCEDKVDNLRAELQRARLELGAGTEQAQALAVCAERVETTWDAFPAALHAGNSDAAIATLTQCIGELLAAVRAVNGSGSGEERGEKRRRDAKESGAIDPQEAGESEEDADIGISDDDQPLEPPTAYAAGRGSTEGLRRKGGKDRRDGARISKAA